MISTWLGDIGHVEAKSSVGLKPDNHRGLFVTTCGIVALIVGDEGTKYLPGQLLVCWLQRSFRFMSSRKDETRTNLGLAATIPRDVRIILYYDMIVCARNCRKSVLETKTT